MYRLKLVEIFASEIAEYLDLAMHGNDFLVRRPCSAANAAPNSIAYLATPDELQSYDFCQNSPILFLIPNDLPSYPQNHSFLVSHNPKLDFIRVVNEYFTETDSGHIATSSKISSRAILQRNVSVGENVVVGPDVTIRENTEILNNVIINGIVEIGRNCLIKDNATIGSIGYNFELDESGLPLHYPSIGKLIVGDHVWIGSNTTIESPSMGNTSIGDYARIDDLVHIGHNSCIGARTMITACAIIGRNVVIGEGCMLAPNCSIRENVSIGNNVIVGTGAVVVSNLASARTYVGNPARFLRDR